MSSKRRRRRIAFGEDHVLADERSDDMTKADLVYVLESLRFQRANTTPALVLLDRGERDYLVDRLKR